MLTVQPGAQAHASAPARARRRPGRAVQLLDGLVGLLAILLIASSWLTHVVVCAAEGLWTFLILGIVVFPVALLHGVAVWLGL